MTLRFMNLIVSPVIACCFFPIYFYFVKDMQLTFMHVMWILAAEFTSMQEILHLLLLAGLEVPGKKKRLHPHCSCVPIFYSKWFQLSYGLMLSAVVYLLSSARKKVKSICYVPVLGLKHNSAFTHQRCEWGWGRRDLEVSIFVTLGRSQIWQTHQ